LWRVPVELAQALYIVPLPQCVVMVKWRRGQKPSKPEALLLPDLIGLGQIFPVPANLVIKRWYT